MTDSDWLIEASDVGIMLFCPECQRPLYYDTRVSLSDLTDAADAHRCTVDIGSGNADA